MLRGLVTGTFDALNKALYLAGEWVFCPLWDRLTGYDVTRAEAEARADIIRNARGDCD